MLMDIQQAGFRVLPGEGEKLSVAMPLDMLRQVIFKITAGKNTIQGQRLFVPVRQTDCTAENYQTTTNQLVTISWPASLDVLDLLAHLLNQHLEFNRCVAGVYVG